MKFSEYVLPVHDELLNTLTRVSDDHIEVLVDNILHCEKIFISGAGRSGLMAKAFCMRLMHIGFDAFVVGETVTPNIGAKDLLIIASGSGGTASLVSMAQKKASIGFNLSLVSIFPDSPIGKIADCVLYRFQLLLLKYLLRQHLLPYSLWDLFLNNPFFLY